MRLPANCSAATTRCGKRTRRAPTVAGISHDIRTPLSVILGYAGELQDDPALPPPEQEQAAVICRQGVRLRDLVSDLNLVSRLEYDMQPLECQWLRPAKLVRRAVTDFMNAMPENPCGIELEEVDESIRLQGDERLLLRALTNLLQNSVLHNPQGCAIRVSVRRDGADACLLSVRDDGVGADPQKLASVLNAPYAPKRAHGWASSSSAASPRPTAGNLPRAYRAGRGVLRRDAASL